MNMEAGDHVQHQRRRKRKMMMALPLYVYLQYANPGTDVAPPTWTGPGPEALVLIIIVMAAQPHRPADRPLLRTQARPLSDCTRRTRVSKRIEVNDLNVYYGNFLAVEDVSLTIEPAPSRPSSGRPDAASPRSCARSTGCTRSSPAPASRARCSSTATTSTVRRRPGAVRRQVGMVFQRPNPFPTMSIGDNVLAGREAQQPADQQDAMPTTWSSGRCAARTCGTRSRTASTCRAPASPAASSSGCASRGRSPSSPTCC